MPQRQPSRREIQDARKLQREQRATEQARRRRRQNWLVVGGSVIAGLVVLGLVGLSIHNRGSASLLKVVSISPDALTATDTTTATATADPSQTSPIKGVTFYTGLTNAAVATKVTYAPIPPVGGAYNAVWLNCGIYNDPVPNEYAVHSLERGAVWITFQSGLDPKSVDPLIKLAKTDGSITLSPYDGLPAKVVASAWGTQLLLDDPKDPRLAQFVTTYRHNANAPEPNASCTGGIGQPRGTVTALPSTPPTPAPSAPVTDLGSPTPEATAETTVTSGATPAATP